MGPKSGFCLIHGKTNAHTLESMMAVIEHRGGYRSGTWKFGNVECAETCLRADRPPDELPAFLPDSDRLRICFDGELGGRDRGKRALRLTAALGTYLGTGS